MVAGLPKDMVGGLCKRTCVVDYEFSGCVDLAHPGPALWWPPHFRGLLLSETNEALILFQLLSFSI